MYCSSKKFGPKKTKEERTERKKKLLHKGTLGCVKGIYCCAESVKNHETTPSAQVKTLVPK